MVTASLKDIIRHFELESLNNSEIEMGNVLIESADVNRPGLQLSGFYDYYDNKRIQIIGRVETTYLKSLSSEEQKLKIDKLFEAGAPAVVICRGIEVFPEMVRAADSRKVPLLRTKETTSRFMSGLIEYLNYELAPCITRHGTLVEVYGVGVLILGESGVGKSETALELVKRGHRLVADDAVEIRKVSEKTITGTAPEMIRHLIEIRGIGILDVKNMYGVGAIRQSKAIELVISLEFWNQDKVYDRLGLNQEYISIFDMEVPAMTIPVRPGRNLAIIVEVAAMNHRQRGMGYNAAKELVNKTINDNRLLPDTPAEAQD